MNPLLLNDFLASHRRAFVFLRTVAYAMAIGALLAVSFWACRGFAQTDGGTVVTVTSAVPVVDVPVVPAGIDWTQILLRVLMAVGAAIGTLVTTVLLPAARSWLQAHAASTDASATTKVLIGATLKLDTFIEAAVAKGWAALQADLKAATDPASDGGEKVTEAELAKAKTDAFNAVKAYLGANGLAELTGALGIGGDLLDTYLKAQIDKKVQAAQAAGSVAAAGITTGAQAAQVLSAL